jgi:hypothetical protein
MVQKIELTPSQRNKLFRICEKRFSAHRTAGRDLEARWSLAMLLLLNLRDGLPFFEMWLAGASQGQSKEHAETLFGFLFDPHSSIAGTALRNAAISDLERLLRLVYSNIRPEADIRHEGSFTPNTRDHAEMARNAILTTILERPGADAYYALCRIAEDSAFAVRAHRFRELARGKAEQDAELLAWSANEVLTFERKRTAPVMIGADLLRVVEAALVDIQFQFDKEDASSRRVFRRAEEEDEVQSWLVEQINFRARGRFRAFREAEVAQGNKPDIIVSSTSASCEVAIEVKHSKNWTLRQLDDALRQQLAEDYLKPDKRRHGVLVITHHFARQWRDTETNEMITFDKLILRLAEAASKILRNSAGAIEVKCLGIDACDPQ